MKKLLFLMLLIPGFAFSQGFHQILRADSSYSGTTLDTLTIGGLRNYSAIYVNLTATDSISMVAKVVGIVNDNYATAATIDSLVTTTAGGKTIALTTGLGGYERALLILDCAHFAGAQSANSGATFSAELVMKK